MKEGIEKSHKLALAKSYLAQGDSKRTAATKTGISLSTLTHWLASEGAAPSLMGKMGRKSSITMTLEEVNRLRYWRLTKDGSLPLAVRELIADPVCREETRATLEAILVKYEDRRQKCEFPPSLRRLAHITGEEMAQFRSKKRTQDYELVISRGLTFIDVDGEERPLLPNSLWESDDMSLNQPFRWVEPTTGKEFVGRQTLCTVDVYSHMWLAGQPIGRDRDAYRVEDIADHMESLISDKGLPYCWRLERGSWESNFIHGIDLGEGKRWGGVDELFHVIHTWKSRTKGTIEGGFRFVQAIMSHCSMDIGRVRGEYDFAARELRRAQHGQSDALARFWTIDDAANALAAAMEQDNASLKERRAHLSNSAGLMVRADDLYKSALIRPVRPQDKWRFCPVKKQATIRNGKVTIKDKYYTKPFEFVVNDGSWDGYLANGTPVLIAFHPGRPQEGCWVFNALPRGDVRNRQHKGFGELIVIAMQLVESPQFTLAGTYSDQQKEANAAMRREFRAIVPAGEHPGLKTSTARDQLGQSLHIKTGGRPETVPAPAPRPVSSPTPAEAPRRRRMINADALRDAAAKTLFGD